MNVWPQNCILGWCILYWPFLRCKLQVQENLSYLLVHCISYSENSWEICLWTCPGHTSGKNVFYLEGNNNIFNCLPHSFQEQELKISWAQEFWPKGCKREHFWLLQYCRHWELKKILLKSVDYRVLIRYVHKKLYIVCNHHISSSIHVNSQFSHTTFWLCSFG